jgi:hypothetical protein
MQSTTRLHDAVANAVLQEAYLIFHDPRAFHPTNGMFNTDADGRDRTIGGFFRWGEITPRRFFLRLDNGDPVEEKALGAPILIEITPVREGIALELSQAFIMSVIVLRRVTQHASMAPWACTAAGDHRGEFAPGGHGPASRHGDHCRGSS